jgi:hypothetical protein
MQGVGSSRVGLGSLARMRVPIAWSGGSPWKTAYDSRRAKSTSGSIPH